MATTDIEWATHVWNFTRGCRRVSPGCGGPLGEGGCYAEKIAYRFSGPGMPYAGLVTLGANGPRWTGKGLFLPDRLDYPLHVRAPREGSSLRFFVNSMSDLFFEEFANEQIGAAFGVMAACREHDFLILTKRPERMLKWFQWAAHQQRYAGAESSPSEVMQCIASDLFRVKLDGIEERPWPLPNVWLGVSVENQKAAEERIPLLLKTPAAIRFISAEPLLGEVHLWAFLKGEVRDRSLEALGSAPYRGLNWVIVGSESGPRARKMELEWARRIVDDCRVAGVPVFVKQIANEHDRKGGDPRHWPDGDWPREFPEVRNG